MLLCFVVTIFSAFVALAVLGAPAPADVAWSLRLNGTAWSQPCALQSSAGDTFIFIASMDGMLHKVRAVDGAVLGRVQTGGRARGAPLCLFKRGAVVVTTLEATVAMYAADTLERIWVWTNEKKSWVFTPIASVDESEIFVGLRENAAVRLAAGNGTLIGRASAGAGVWGAPLLTADGRFIIAVTAATMVHSFRLEAVTVGSTESAQWTFDCVVGASSWKKRTKSWIFSSPVDTRAACGADVGGIIFGSNDGLLRCVNAETGRLKWSAMHHAPISATAVIVNGTILSMTERGVVAALTCDGEALWRYSLPQSSESEPAVIYAAADGVDGVGLVVADSGGNVVFLAADGGIWGEAQLPPSSCAVKARPLVLRSGPRLVVLTCTNGAVVAIRLPAALHTQLTAVRAPKVKAVSTAAAPLVVAVSPLTTDAGTLPPPGSQMPQLLALIILFVVFAIVVMRRRREQSGRRLQQ